MTPVAEAVRIREVGPRDGLQAEAPVPPAGRVRLVRALVAAGLRSVEVAAFVSPRAVPAMAGAEEVVDGLDRPAGVSYAALVANLAGARRVRGCHEVTFTISASPAHNRRNVRMSVEESLAEAAAVAAHLGPGVPVDAVVSCAFGSPDGGHADPGAVDDLGRRLLAAGAASLTYADTTGVATPRRVAALLARSGPGVGLHLHDTRGTALVNAYAGLELGVRRFDTAVGGLGGSPFAAGSGGNLATEDLVHLLDDLGVGTGVDLGALLAAGRLAADLVGHPLPSRVAAAGPPPRPAPA